MTVSKVHLLPIMLVISFFFLLITTLYSFLPVRGEYVKSIQVSIGPGSMYS